MIDTHAHLLSFENDGEKIIKNMRADGLEAIVTIGTTVLDSKKSVEIAQKHENIYAAVGIYPEFANNTTILDIEEIRELGKQEKVVAIGEIGLDYHGENVDKAKQKWLFIEQLKIAHELHLPFCIHCRNAAEDVYQILSENRHLIENSGLMHCYSEGANWVKKFLELGLYISFSGNITFKKSDRSFLREIPLDKILIETDSPYLAPEPVRGTKNEPKNVRFVCDKIAFELKINSAEFEKITSENARRVYNLK